MAQTRRQRAGIAAAADRGVIRPPLDRDVIVGAALALLDEVGLDGLSMRNLAERLTIKAASLYWYVRDKEELLGLLADAICVEVGAPVAEAPWRAQLETLLGEYRRILQSHRDAARILFGTIPTGPHRLRLVDMSLAALGAAGFEGMDIVRAARLLVDNVTSSVLEEANEAALAARVAGQESGEEGAPSAAYSPFTSLPASAYPSIAALAALLAEPDGDGRFQFGLKVMLDGLERQLPPPGERPV